MLSEGPLNYSMVFLTSKVWASSMNFLDYTPQELKGFLPHIVSTSSSAFSRGAREGDHLFGPPCCQSACSEELTDWFTNFCCS